MTTDFAKLRKLYTEASRAAFRELQDRHAGDRFYAFGLYSDDGAMTVVPTVSSEESLRRTIQTYSEAAGTIPELGYLRWCPDEWKYSGSRWEDWKEASELHQQMLDSWALPFDEFKRRLLEMMIDCLRDLDADGYFGAGAERANITLLIWVTDAADSQQWLIRSVQELNPKEVFLRFSSELPNV